MAKCPYNSSSEYCEIEVQLEVAKVAENEATETFHEMDAEIRRLLQRIECCRRANLSENRRAKTVFVKIGRKQRSN